MNEYQDYWNEVYSNQANNEIKYDNWLDSYKDIIRNIDNEIIDLGCGKGNNALYLSQMEKHVIACDYSDIALEIIKHYLDKSYVKTMQFDMTEPLPFNDNFTNLIISDLSLHYFSKQKTLEILKEIKRVLKNNGYLIFRVNSIKDTNYGANNGKKIENNFYHTMGYNKRFFDENDIYYFFQNFDIIDLKEDAMERYKSKKHVWIGLVKNNF